MKLLYKGDYVSKNGDNYTVLRRGTLRVVILTGLSGKGTREMRWEMFAGWGMRGEGDAILRRSYKSWEGNKMSIEEDGDLLG